MALELTWVLAPGSLTRDRPGLGGPEWPRQPRCPCPQRGWQFGGRNFHHSDKLIVFLAPYKRAFTKTLALGEFYLLADHPGRLSKIALSQNILLEQERTPDGIGHAF